MSGNVPYRRWSTEDQEQPPVTSVRELCALYDAGERTFKRAKLDGADLRGIQIPGASLLRASMKNAIMDGADLMHVQLKGANLTGAKMKRCRLIASDSIDTNFSGADLSGSDFTGTHFERAKFDKAVLSGALFNNVTLGRARLAGAYLDGVELSSADLCELDVRPLCDARKVKHLSPSTIDARTVMLSYSHPRLKRFMLDCGVPDLFAEYMIDCARALGEPLIRSMMQSTFISYGGPDEKFARKLYDALRSHSVITFFFPETATVGERIGDEVYKGIQNHDRVILVCSRNSLNRAGVLHEIQETFDREARDGGATYLLPITLDDYVFTDWSPTSPSLAERVRTRVVADFRKTSRSSTKFDAALSRLIDALKIKRP
ncbi:toll/interleukin-1 receptor domain-containing protein [Micromonospora sp. NPDC048947]|uniref:toll/interleukin-1 receptor domain-containing protein n=1 Tax=Micromonospora sp. NPDC048947 TaxID=3154826 RepID=UPI0033EF6647